MLFNSVSFLFAFLPIAYVVFWKLRTRRQRYVWLTITGYAFYSFWDYRFCALMAFSTLISYLAGRGLLRWDHSEGKRRLCLIIPIVIDLGLLAFFKYTGLLLDTVRAMAERFGFPASVPTLHIILPVGISFYTFHTISYIVDGYRRTIRPTRDFFEFSCYVSLFCQLVAGPIVRFRQIEGDLENLDRIDRHAFWERGWSFFAIGMIKKVLIADTIAKIIDPALEGYRSLSTLDAWATMLGYSFQLYFDFSGYSDMAVGLGCLFGLRIPQNFDSPYKATDPSDFWRRWHISLSTCLRDYVYIPLGGNRRLAYRNLLLTMLIGGLWHGASWTFVIWGAYHGILLMLYKRFAATWDAVPLVARRISMFVAVVVGWAIFRSTSFSMARSLLTKMFSWEIAESIPAIGTLGVLLLICSVITQLTQNSWELSHSWRPRAAIALAACFSLSLAAMYAVDVSPFLYFQF